MQRSVVQVRAALSPIRPDAQVEREYQQHSRKQSSGVTTTTSRVENGTQNVNNAKLFPSRPLGVDVNGSRS